MKATTIRDLSIRALLFSLFVLGTFSPQQVHAQDWAFSEAYEQYSPAELAQMLAPIALYPDTLLSRVEINSHQLQLPALECIQSTRSSSGLSVWN